MKKRKYTLRRRAEKQQQTRERIVDAAMALHEEIGPAETTISALAERAGVQRLTVYRHFADEGEILKACSARWLELNSPPALPGSRDGEPIERARSMLSALYTYYRQTQSMWSSLYRDLDRMPALTAPMARFESYLKTVENDLLAAWAPKRSRRLRATIGHVLRFSTWESLSRQGLGQKTMTDLACDWIQASV